MASVKVRPEMVVCTFSAQRRFRKVHYRDLEDHRALGKSGFYFGDKFLIGRYVARYCALFFQRRRRRDLIEENDHAADSSCNSGKLRPRASTCQPVGRVKE